MSKPEIGGYFEFENYYGKILHDKAVALDCGRNCLSYIIKSKNIKRILLPYYICDVVVDACKANGVQTEFYRIDKNFLPEDIAVKDGQWLYIVNYFGQLDKKGIKRICLKYNNVIFDFAHAYFEKPVRGRDTIYTCRKFFGVSDGGFLYTDKYLSGKLPKDESYDKMDFVLGRYEKSSYEFFKTASANNNRFDCKNIKSMSTLTLNLLRSFNYKKILKKRTKNYRYLSEKLGKINLLKPKKIKGAFAYPLLVKGGAKLKEKLIDNGVFVPTLWPNVLNCAEIKTTDAEYVFAADLIPLPVDQRYDVKDMEYIVGKIKIILNELKEEK